jgi:uncharacterized protein (TIGR00251 family)
VTTLTLRVTPRAKNTAITEITDELIRIRIQSPPVDGKANKVLLKTLAKWLSIPASHLTLISGEKSRIKRVLIPSLPAPEIRQRLEATMAKAKK